MATLFAGKTIPTTECPIKAGRTLWHKRNSTAGTYLLLFKSLKVISKLHRGVLQQMLKPRHYGQVFWPVIKLVFVYVVHDIAAIEHPFQHLRRYNSMLWRIVLAIAHGIPRRINEAISIFYFDTAFPRITKRPNFISHVLTSLSALAHKITNSIRSSHSAIYGSVIQ